jgi:hypothetical protein
MSICNQPQMLKITFQLNTLMYGVQSTLKHFSRQLFKAYLFRDK